MISRFVYSRQVIYFYQGANNEVEAIAGRGRLEVEIHLIVYRYET